MDSFEWNKIAGAVLFAMLIVMGIREVNNIVNHVPERPEQMGYVVPGVEAVDEGSAPAEPKVEPLAVRLAKGTVEDGSKAFKKCMACHTVEDGGPNRVGPNLYNTVGNHFGHKADFNFSDAVKNHGGTWTYEDLDHWLENPRDFIPGNKMGFAGISDAQQRADVILYLREYTPNPPPLPEPPPPEEAAPEEDAAPAEGEAPAADAPAEEAPAEEAPAEEPAQAG